MNTYMVYRYRPFDYTFSGGYRARVGCIRMGRGETWKSAVDSVPTGLIGKIQLVEADNAKGAKKQYVFMEV